MRYLIQNSGPNHKARRAALANPSPSRSYPYLRRSNRVMVEEARGRQLIEAMIVRGLQVNRPVKRVRRNPVSAAVARYVKDK